jgi:hypothetical protein
MKKAIAVFLRPGSKWNPDKPVREQAFWDDHARFMDALFDDGIVVLGGPFADGSASMVILETGATARSFRAGGAAFRGAISGWASRRSGAPSSR